MMKFASAFLFMATCLCSISAYASDSDILGQLQLKFSSKSPDVVIARTVSDIRAVFQNYQPAVDSGTTIKSPVQVTGSSTHPFMEVTMEKCVLIICQTVNMKADITVQEVTGRCTKNYVIKADLTRSSELLANVYDAFNVAVCYNRTSQNQAEVTLSGAAHKARSYGPGPVQGEIYNLLKLQLNPIGKATEKVLRSHSLDL